MRQLNLALPLLLLLAACGSGTGPALDEKAPRQASAPIWSNAQLDKSRLVGEWQQVGDFAPRLAGCASGKLRVAEASGQLKAEASLCQNGRAFTANGDLRAIGPGRFSLGGQEWWVIWVDTDYRTLAIGTPSGAFGFLLNRGGALPSDRLIAAREVFAFNGYDAGRLVGMSR